MPSARTAVDVQDLSRHEAGLFEVHDRVDDLVNLTGIVGRANGTRRRHDRVAGFANPGTGQLRFPGKR